MKPIFLLLVLLTFSFTISYAQNDKTQKKIKIGLVLSGGGVKGLAHIGVIKVLEELGCEIDYICGTSMGGIIGGLVAMGYNTEQLQKMMQQDWEKLIFDQIDRSRISMSEKKEMEKYIVNVPLKNFKVVIPKGLLSGQNLENLFTKLTLPVRNVKEFSKLKIPFFCVATNVENMTQVVIEKGSLAEAMKASMAIPGLFKPVKINGKLLLDGGLVNNFPAEELKKRDIDVIIGVNVANNSYKKDELNSIINILTQSILYNSQKAAETSKNICNIYIKPDILDFNTLDFSSRSVDIIIQKGEEAAKKQYSQLKSLIDSVKKINYKNQIQKKKKCKKIKIIDSIFVKKLNFIGLKNVAVGVISGNMKIRENTKISIKEIEANIENVYGTNFFETVTYHVEDMESGGQKLTIKVKEKNLDYFSFGANFNSDYKAALLLSVNYRNLLLKGSKIIADFRIGNNIQSKIKYYKNISKKRGINGIFSTQLRVLDAFSNGYQHKENQYRMKLKYTNLNFNLGAESNYSNNHFFSAGVEYKYNRTKIDDINYHNKQTVVLFNYYFKFNQDTYDKKYYPKKGSKIDFEYHFISDVRRTTKEYIEKLKPSHYISISYSQAISITNKVTSKNMFFSALSTSDATPHLIIVGGNGSNYKAPFVPFFGVPYSSYWIQTLSMARSDLQYNVFDKVYLTGVINISTSFSNFNYKDGLSIKKILHNIELGYGLKIGINTLVGPLEISWGRYNNSNKNQIYLNLGYNF